MTAGSRRQNALVLSGGFALGAYQAGAYAAMQEHGQFLPDHIAAASVGSVNAALIAGNAPEHRVERLRAFWTKVSGDISSFWWFGYPADMAWRQGLSLASAMQSHLWGRPGLFQRRLLPEANGRPGLHDLAPLSACLTEMVDFDRLNRGFLRLSLTATDVASGERVVFDTADRTEIGPQHVLASSAMVPIFAPIEIDGRLLGDGGLSSNTPIDLVLDNQDQDDLLCFVVDLFSRQGQVPRTLAAGLSRTIDLIFGNQSHNLLEAQVRERKLRAAIALLIQQLPPEMLGNAELAPLLAEGSAARALILSLGYRAGPQEIGPGKLLDYSSAALKERWQAGAMHMGAALKLAENPPSDAGRPGLLAVHVAVPTDAGSCQ